MEHLVLAGDSIFDNAAYVPGGDPVILQLRSRLEKGSRASLLAEDGAMASSVARQLSTLPSDCTHLIVSVGGNNALGSSYILQPGFFSAKKLLQELTTAQQDFTREYHEMLRAVGAARKPTLICTIYDAIPGLEPEAVTALSLFNDVILRAGIQVGLPILDLRFVCSEPGDYASLSPIEPSEVGGSKIVRAILRVVKSHDFERPETVIYR